jgi:hypothetical protein
MNRIGSEEATLRGIRAADATARRTASALVRQIERPS